MKFCKICKIQSPLASLLFDCACTTYVRKSKQNVHSKSNSTDVTNTKAWS
jgi:hypothetical protein